MPTFSPKSWLAESLMSSLMSSINLCSVEAGVFPQIALTAMWMQQGKPNSLRESVEIRAKNCRRTVPVQVLKKKLLAILVQIILYPADRVPLRGLAGVVYARIMTPTCAPQHPCLPTHTHTCIHTYTFTDIHIHSHTYTQTHTHTNTHLHTHAHLHAHIHAHSQIFTHTFKHIHIHSQSHLHTHTLTHIQTFTHTHAHARLH